MFAELWDVKGKFPPSVKPILADVALKAVRLGEYDEDFFSLMPVLFPYNRFTMTVRLPLLAILSGGTNLSARNSSRGLFSSTTSRF